MSAQHVAIPVYVRIVGWNFTGEDTRLLLPLVRRAYRGSRSIDVLFSRDLRLIRASPQLLIELWNCIPIRDDVATAVVAVVLVVVVVENGCKRAAALTRVHNSFFFFFSLFLSFFSLPLSFPFFFRLFFSPFDEIVSRRSREDRRDHRGWRRSHTGRYTRKKKRSCPPVRNDVTPQGRVLRWRTRVLILSSTAMTCSAIKFTSFHFLFATPPTPTISSLGINLAATACRASRVYGNKISAINIEHWGCLHVNGGSVTSFQGEDHTLWSFYDCPTVPCKISTHRPLVILSQSPILSLKYFTEFFNLSNGFNYLILFDNYIQLDIY